MNPLHRSAVLVALTLVAGGASAQLAQGNVFALRVANEVSSSSFDDPSGLGVRPATLWAGSRGEGLAAQAEAPRPRVADARPGLLYSGPEVSGTGQGIDDLRLKVSMPLGQAAETAPRVDLVLGLKSGARPSLAGLVLRSSF